MYLCYMDESGTSDIPGTSSHFVLVGFSIPVNFWKKCDLDIESIKSRYGLSGKELHVAWMIKDYREQMGIPDFASLDYAHRRTAVIFERQSRLLALQRSGNRKSLDQTKKNFAKTVDYIHLTREERRRLVKELATVVSGWGVSRLFAECIDKRHFDEARVGKSIDEQAFEQIVSRFEEYLQSIGSTGLMDTYGMLIHDNNNTIARKHTDLMRRFHQSGTLWVNVKNTVETPLFVDSKLTGMIQIADLCGYALRRYVENGEEELFDLIFKRADRKRDKVVGVRHFTNQPCSCKICASR